MTSRLWWSGCRSPISEIPSPEPRSGARSRRARRRQRSGKTNIHEAVSLPPRQAKASAAHPSPDLARADGSGGWSVAARVHTEAGAIDIGTGLQGPANLRPRRPHCPHDGEAKTGSGISPTMSRRRSWVTPATDASSQVRPSERRRFLDRPHPLLRPRHRTARASSNAPWPNAIACSQDDHGRRATRQSRDHHGRDGHRLRRRPRRSPTAALAGIIETRKTRDPKAPSPGAASRLEGDIDRDLAIRAAVDVEDSYIARLRQTRERDRGAGRTLDGPHRTDLVVTHGRSPCPPNSAPRRTESPSLGLVLPTPSSSPNAATASAPILLLDEVTAQLGLSSPRRPLRLVAAIGTQAWMTGTTIRPF